MNNPDSPTAGSASQTAFARDEALSKPGLLLQKAREAHSFTRADVAARLRLNVRMIAALEEGDWSALPAVPTFVRGYLRNYARLVNVLPEPFLAAYERQGSIVPLPAVAATALQRQPSNSDRLWRFFTYVVVLSLFVLVGLWWQSRDALDHIASPSIPPTHASKEAPRPNTEPPQVLATDPPPEDNSEAHVLTQTAPPSVPTSGTASVHTADLTNTQGSVSGSAVHPADTATKPPTASNPTPPPAGPPTVTVQTTVETWVRIKDGAGDVLFNAPIPAGTPRSFQGHPPFKVRLRKAEGVTVTYNGEVFDFSPYIKDEAASFSLGKRNHAPDSHH